MQSPLPYAPPLPWHRSRKAQRTVIGLLILAAITCSAVWAFRFAQQLRFLHQQHRWMRYTMQADRIILAAGDAAMPLLNDPDYFHPTRSWDGHRFTDAVRNPNKLAADPYWGSLPLIFLHQRRAPDGGDRLISVFPTLDRTKDYSLLAEAEVPANAQPGSRPSLCKAMGISGEYRFEAPMNLKVFAGQPDPADESHFTIRFDLDGKFNIIDGWLMPDDTVKLEPRK
jgi:hypothetical protein